jgi:hypothetical protein
MYLRLSAALGYAEGDVIRVAVAQGVPRSLAIAKLKQHKRELNAR